MSLPSATFAPLLVALLALVPFERVAAQEDELTTDTPPGASVLAFEEGQEGRRGVRVLDER